LCWSLDYRKGGLKDMPQGKVKWFSKGKGYGFISPLGGGEEVFVEDFFVRNSGVAGARSTTLEEGERVLYQVTRDEWGPTAENVCILRSSRQLEQEGQGRRTP
jgi:CspA family cold shock protein